MRDLIILVADNDMEQALRGLLEQRRHALQTRDIDFEIIRHPYRDSGCCSKSDVFLRPFINKFDYAMVMFDHHGSGQENISRTGVERRIENMLNKNGWNDRNCAVVIEPELENWIWVNSPELSPILKWNSQNQSLNDWLSTNADLTRLHKPTDPKGVLETILKITKTPRSARLYRKVAETVTLENCRDRSFLKFRNTLTRWFSNPND